MLIRVAVFAGLLVAQLSRLEVQSMTSPAYENFADKADAVCPARGLRHLHPADLDGIEEDFMPTMTRRERHQVATLNRGDKGCTGAGASCAAQNTLAAISRTGLLNAFVSFACVRQLTNEYLGGWAALYRLASQPR